MAQCHRPFLVLYSPQTIVAAGYDQGAIAVEMHLKARRVPAMWGQRLWGPPPSAPQRKALPSSQPRLPGKPWPPSPPREPTAETGSEWAGSVFRHFPVLTSQILTLSSNWKGSREESQKWRFVDPQTPEGLRQGSLSSSEGKPVSLLPPHLRKEAPNHPS